MSITQVADELWIFANSNHSFCGETEDNDPNPDFEEYLSCKVCGDNGELHFLRRKENVHFMFWRGLAS